ncbi:hypothetical protein IT775_20855 [Thalassobius aquimarinus]|uniref:Uncharacterized protein n=2 Tax=Thalassovita aquimarina TaxID=2785917 RepID=A0ABS5HXZ7_9RHOB|nr:hypothetical protein [Thalassovita aquimarina]
MKFLVKNCLAHFAQQTGHPVKIDKNRLLKMGFSISRDETFIFKAQHVIKEGDYIFAKERFGPAIEIDRNRRKPDDVKYWTCNITTSDTVKTTDAYITNMTSLQVQKLIEKEAQRMGFKPFKGKRNKTIWTRNGVPMTFRVTFFTKSGQRQDGSSTPAGIYFQGAHPKYLP